MLHCIQAGHALDLDGPVLSGGYRRFCTAKPPPRSPYATASLRRSGSTDSTPLRPTSRRHRPGRPARTRRSDSAQRSAGSRPTARRTAHRRAAETCHPLTLCWKQPGWLPPGHPPTGTSAAISSRLGIPTVQVCRALRTLANEWNIDPRQAAEQPLQALGEVKCRISKAIEDPGEPRRTAPARRLDQPHQPDPRQRATRTGPNRR
jgi:hypothetical protein